MLMVVGRSNQSRAQRSSTTERGQRASYEYDLAVVGLGYVGLPLAVAAAEAGLRVVGIDSDQSKVTSLARGNSYISDVSDDSLRRIRQQGFTVSAEHERLRLSESIIIAVPTPLNGGQPDLSFVLTAAAEVGSRMSSGQLVVLESTTYPGTTEDRVIPVLESHSGMTAGTDFHLAYSPERIDPANRSWTIENTPKLVAGFDSQSTMRARALYGAFCAEIVPVSGIREAEMAKLLENTYRHVNIALMNEMSVFCDELDIDLWEVIRAASTKPFGYQAFYPGPGVGGHCIPIDPSYLSYRVRQLGYPFRFVELASEINDRMPAYVVQRIGRMLNEISLPIRGSKVLLVGVAYKANVNDTRESPAIPLASQLSGLGAELGYIDPVVDRFSPDSVTIRRFDDPTEAGDWCDVAVVLAPHDALDLGLVVSTARLVFDTRGVVKRDGVEHL